MGASPMHLFERLHGRGAHATEGRKMSLTRRDFLRSSIAAGAAIGTGALPRIVVGETATSKPTTKPALLPKADAMVVIYLPGGLAQRDVWDLKKHTPYVPNMKGSDLLATCPAIPTSADGIQIGAGLETLATQMHHATILRTLTNEVHFGAVHLKAQYYLNTGYLFPAGFKAPSIGAVVSRSRGRRDPNVPPYIYIGRDIDSSNGELLFINEFIGPGFYGINHSPFMIPDASAGLATLSGRAGMSMGQIDRRRELFDKIASMESSELRDAQKAQDYLKTMEDARAMMDSPVKKAFNFKTEEKPEVIAAYQPQIKQSELRDQTYDNGNRFGNGLLLARRLLEHGARFIQVEYQYGPFKGFDMHEYGAPRMIEMKKEIDRPIAQFIKELSERGMLDRTLVVIMTEFGRTIASAPAAGSEPDGFAERHTGEDLVIASEQMYGFHGHFSSTNCMVMFGGGFKGGYVHGKTADHHPMTAIENPVSLTDTHATLYKAMGIAPDTNFVTESRPVYVTNNGKGVPVDAMLT
jgi:hypothetical protein